MNFFRETFAPIAFYILVAVIISVGLLMYGMNNFEGECVDKGGKFMVEGWTAWCRY